MTMASRSPSRSAAGCVLIALALAGTRASAHRYDELLQAARIAIAPQRVEVELSLTPGMAVADGIIGEIDRDRDGELSDAERRHYVASVASAMHLAVDGRPLTLSAIASTFPGVAALRGGDSPIELRFAATLPSLTSGQHRVSFSNAYRPDIGVYLANALVPEDDRITVVNQQRDPEQRATTIDYAIASTASTMLPVWLFAPAAAAWLLLRSGVWKRRLHRQTYRFGSTRN
jgi:hypothetical protein